MLNFDEGYVFFLFGRKERTKEKSFMSFFRYAILIQTFLGWAIYGKRPHFLALFGSPRASGAYFYTCLRLTLAIILLRFGIPRMDYFCIGTFPPRHVRHPSAAQMDVRR